MSPQTTILWLWGAAAAISAISSMARGSVKAWNRARSMAGMAQELGFTYTAWMGPEAAPKIGTELFQKDGGATCKNVLSGNFAGLQTQVFDYAYTTGSPGTQSTTVQSVAVYKQNVDLPRFTVMPGNLALRIIAAVQHQKADLEYPPGVSHHYAVTGPDKERIRALFNGSLLSFIEGLDHRKGWHIEGAGDTLVVYRYRDRVKPTGLRDFLQETSSIAQSFLAYSGVKAASAR